MLYDTPIEVSRYRAAVYVIGFKSKCFDCFDRLELARTQLTHSRSPSEVSSFKVTILLCAIFETTLRALLTLEVRLVYFYYD